MSTIAADLPLNAPGAMSTGGNNPAKTDMAFFNGFLRPDGRVGVRNHLLILSTVALTNRWAELAADKSGETVVVGGDFLRGLRGGDAVLQEDVLESLVFHPNVGAALILCFDRVAGAHWQKKLKASSRPATVLVLMDQEGMAGAIKKAQIAIHELDILRGKVIRTSQPLSALTIALECGGSDATSAICANPGMGRFVERLVKAGGAAIVSETAEFIGAEDVVRARAISPQVAERVLACISHANQRTEEDGERYRGVNPTQENIEAGLTTLVEKSMGAICKIGTLAIDGCLDFGQQPPKSGLYFMDTPFFSPVSLTGMAAAGAQVTLFALGVFNPSGNPLVPTIKICGNRQTLSTWADSIDVSLAGLLGGSMTLEDAGNKIAEMAATVASGAPSRAEHWGEGQVIIPKTTALI